MRILSGLIVFSLVTLIGLWGSQVWGPGSSPDSASYVMAARQFAAGLAPQQVDGSPFASWPPLFPLLMALIHQGSVPLITGGRWINALCLGGVVTGVCALAGRRHPFAALVAAAFLIGNTGILRVFSTLWSEPLMILGFLLGLIFVEQPVLAGLFLGLGLLSRYVGIVGLGVVVLWLFLRPERLQDRLKKIGLLLLTALPGPLLWSLYVHWVDGAAPRRTTSVGIYQNGYDFFNSLSDTFWQSGLHTPFLGLSLWGLALFAGFFWTRGRHGSAALVISTWYLLIYPLFLIVASSFTVVAILGTRFVSPLLPAMALILAEGVARLPKPQMGLVLLLPLWFNAVQTLDYFRSKGIGGISAPSWCHATVLDWAPSQTQVISNRPDIPALVWNHPVELSPQIHPFRSPHLQGEGLESLQTALQSGPRYLLWFKQSPGRDWYFYSPDELQDLGFELELLMETEQGSFYRIDTLQSAAATRRVPPFF